MKKNKKSIPPAGSSNRSTQHNDQRKKPTNIDTRSQKNSFAEDNNAIMRFENKYERVLYKDASADKVSKQNYKPDPDQDPKQGSKQSKERITNKGVNQNTKSVNK